MKTYNVTLPIAGHLFFEVEADSEDEALDKAHLMDADDGELQWETVGQFNKGNVCYCPAPWKETVELVDDDNR